MHFSLIACTSSFISLSLHRCALGLLQTYIVEIPSCQNHGSKSQGFCVSHSLVHDIKWKGGEGGGGEDIVSLSPKLHLLILDLCGSGDWCCLCCFSCVWSHPRLVLSWMFSLRLSLKITSLLTPPTSVAVYLESATASGESRGAFWSLLAHSQFCCLGRFYRRGVTQLCIVFYSLALLGVHLKFGSSESTK